MYVPLAKKRLPPIFNPLFPGLRPKSKVSTSYVGCGVKVPHIEASGEKLLTAGPLSRQPGCIDAQTILCS